MSAAPTVAVAATAAEQELCLALRYRVYVEEAGRPSLRADHARRLDLSADDASGVLFLARVGAAPAATVRVHHGAAGGIPPFVRTACGLPERAPLPAVGAISRLAVDPAHRGTRAVVELLRAAAAWLEADGRTTDALFILALDEPRLLALYGALGFAPLADPPVRHPSEIGPVVPMVRYPPQRQASNAAAVGAPGAQP